MSQLVRLSPLGIGLSTGTSSAVSEYERYYIYRDNGDGSIDYTTPVGFYIDGDTTVDVPLQALDGATWRYAVRARSTLGACDQTSESSPTIIVEVDGSGNMVEPMGNIPYGLSAVAVKDAKVLLKWGYNPVNQDATPTGFKVYRSTDAATWSEQSTVAYGGGKSFSWTSGALTDGTTYYYLVRTYITITAVDHEEGNVKWVSVVADSTGPPAITNITVSVIDG